MASMDRETELSLVEGLRNGDPGAFDAAYEAYRARVFGFLVRLSRSRTVAEDLLDETWLRLVSAAARLRADTRLLPWLFTVARNLYWTYRRSSALEETLDPCTLALWPSLDGRAWPFEVAAHHELQRRLDRALARLSPRHREVLLLVGVEGLTPSEAAIVCGLTPEALRQLLTRARAAPARAIDPSRHGPRRGGTEHETG
jgi:RNA polymerase sigma-70 factor (ECF subfamily)